MTFSGGAASSCTVCGSNTYALGGASACLPMTSGFDPARGNIVVLRLSDPKIQTPLFYNSVPAFLDELAPVPGSDFDFTLVRTIALPPNSSDIPIGQYPITMFGNDIYQNHDQNHAGIISLTQDGQGIVLGGTSGPPGVGQPVLGDVACCASAWTGLNGASNYVATSNLVVGTVDFAGVVDVSSIVQLASQSYAAFIYSATASCVPSLPGCTAGGFLVDTNSYTNACAMFWTPYLNNFGFTGSSGSGSFAWSPTCSSNGAGRTVAMTYHGYVHYMVS